MPSPTGEGAACGAGLDSRNQARRLSHPARRDRSAFGCSPPRHRFYRANCCDEFRATAGIDDALRRLATLIKLPMPPRIAVGGVQNRFVKKRVRHRRHSEDSEGNGLHSSDHSRASVVPKSAGDAESARGLRSARSTQPRSLAQCAASNMGAAAGRSDDR